MYVILLKEHEGITDVEKVTLDEEVLTCYRLSVI